MLDGRICFTDLACHPSVLQRRTQTPRHTCKEYPGLHIDTRLVICTAGRMHACSPVYALQGASASEASAVRDVAGLTLVDFARFQDIVQFDLADSPAITQLKGDSQYGALYNLMGLLLAGDVKVRLTAFNTPAIAPSEIVKIHAPQTYLLSV